MSLLHWMQSAFTPAEACYILFLCLTRTYFFLQELERKPAAATE